jgi:hypothetical protein
MSAKNAQSARMAMFRPSIPALIWQHRAAPVATPARDGYEIVDEHARREIFLQGTLVEHFKQGIET